ncbi:hypothetical protein ACFFX1_42815 [Dactylosporangium sucinum]|uniref:Uncharacterized protein n=1 Tax=Dactylosporangium sucinum TaxID=1424081 RepID=A0A917TYI7_9ACTN|nr:hypothetical protein [Dactylosporangium sucinum]GGM44627.1 hypothetical protein GCM10007977_052790 [Dactylosporangium sucinum]
MYDTLLGLIIICIALFSPFANLLLRALVFTPARELAQAARMDRAGEPRTGMSS